MGLEVLCESVSNDLGCVLCLCDSLSNERLCLRQKIERVGPCRFCCEWLCAMLMLSASSDSSIAKTIVHSLKLAVYGQVRSSSVSEPTCFRTIQLVTKSVTLVYRYEASAT
jgi:hypothetical protein